MNRRLFTLVSVTFLGVSAAAVAAVPATRPAAAAKAEADVRVVADVEYARVGDHALRLDLHLPPVANPPLVVWVHGGAWRGGSKADMPLAALVRRGYAVASVDYRLSPVARFPAQVHDVKAAVRFLRARRADHGYDAGRVAVAGSSAGGHLALLVGVTNGHRELEGDVGGYRDQSSDVHAIVSLYGMSNLTTILGQSTPHGLGVRVPALELLLGGRPDDQPALARLASPVFHADAADPPLLLFHGDQDPQVPINQAHEIHGRYAALGRPVTFHVVHGGRHGGPEFLAPDRVAVVDRFLAEHLARR